MKLIDNIGIKRFVSKILDVIGTKVANVVWLPIRNGVDSNGDTVKYAIVEGGDDTKATAAFSHAEGNKTTASGPFSHAEGVVQQQVDFVLMPRVSSTMMMLRLSTL